MIYAETEREVRRNFEEKWARDTEMRVRMTEIIRKYGLGRIQPQEAMRRSIGVAPVTEQGAGWTAAHNDCVDEARRMASDSVGLIMTSVPFGTQYEYCESYNDFGHNDDNPAFFRQMDFLTPELLRILQPGRVMAVHVKDRIIFGAVNGLGFPTVDPFHSDCIAHYRRHGFALIAVRTIETDVVRENNQTYRLGYSEMRKDATRMGSGSPEYVLFFRKPQTDRSRGYADDPVAKTIEEYTLGRWQLDAAAYWRSSGNRLLTADELAGLNPDALARAFKAQSAHTVYDHEAHVALAENLGDRKALPKTFSALAVDSPTGDVWTDIVRMRTLNADQSLGGREKHVCPLQIDVVDRCIRLYSAKGDLVFDPFAGLFTVPARALALGRRARGSELNAAYFRDGVRYLRLAEREASIPTLFDLLDTDQAA
jgi:DNA modification methylase